MKRKLFMVTALVLLVLASGFAEGTTWSNPNDILFGNFFTLPKSMPAEVSNGIYYDEIDTIILSPAELSNYEGYSIFTGYGNYEYYDTGDFLNPFTDINLTDGTHIGLYKLGATGELFGFRGGVLSSFEVTKADRMGIAVLGPGTTESYYELEEPETVDADADGTADFTYINTQTYTDYDSDSVFVFGAGLDLDFVGASVYSLFSNNLRKFGGSYTYTRPLTADADNADPADLVRSKTVLYGHGEDGKPVNDPNLTYSDWLFGVRAHVPLEVADISMPVKADFVFGQENNNIGANAMMKTETITASNLTGITDETKTNTITASYGETAVVSGWNPTTDAGVLGADPVYTEANFRTLAANVETAAAGFGYALDPENYKDTGFITGFDALVDPEIAVSDVFSLRTRAQLGYMFSYASSNNAGIRSVTYSEAEETTTTPSSYTFSAATSAPQTTVANIIDFELGGLMDLHNEDDTLGVACGLFYHPNIQMSSVKAENYVTTTSESWIDSSAVNEATAWGDAIGPADFEGTFTSTTTTTFQDGKVIDNTEVVHTFYIPAATRVKFAKGKLELLGSYLLSHDFTTSTTKDYTSLAETDTVSTLANSTGGTIDPPADDSVASPAAGVEISKTKDSAGWAGQMSWMLRWNAMEGMTVDFHGATIVDALDFEIFGDTDGTDNVDGFNPVTFIDNLGISVTISAK